MARNAANTKLIEEIGEVLKRAQNSVAAFKAAVANKHIIVFLGNTRSGKSTLVNYIIGTKLISFEERNPIFKIKKANEQAAGPVIGQGSQSCTTIPGVYPLNEFGIVVIDAPGFDDNRNEGQDIVNALYINQIKHAKTVKFILVCDMNELIIDNVKGFTDLIEKVHALFPSFESLKNSVSIVFTKDFRNYIQSDVASLLRRKIFDVEGLPINKQLVQHFIENEELIALFKMPSRAGPVTNEIDVNIESSRVTSCALLLREASIRVALSSRSRLSLIKIYQAYLDSAYFEQELGQIISKFNDYFAIDDYVFASTNDELSDVKQNLKHISSVFEKEIDKNMSSLSEINNSLIGAFSRNFSQDFTKSFAVLVMIDRNFLMEDVIKGKFITKYKQSLKGILDKIEKLVCTIDDEIKNRRRNRRLFNASAAVGGTAGGATATAEVLHRVLAESSRFASPFGILGLVGALVTGVGAGIAAASFAVEKKTEQKRTKARERQGRAVYDNMFKED